MDAILRLKNKPNVIGAASDFTYHWALDSGLSRQQAGRLAVAVSELVTDVVLFAFGPKEGEMELTYLRHTEHVEVVVHELGEPFNPDRHRYDPELAVREGDFEGAGFELVRCLADDFIYLNRGKQGKEFRLVMRVKAPHIVDLVPGEELRDLEDDPDDHTRYTVRIIQDEDAEAISKLIYRTYGHTYHKESLYFPRKIELSIRQNEKFGVITRTRDGEPAGYFAVSMSTDANIGEVGEAVVAVHHRRRGLMTRMLHKLVEEARRRALLGVFGEANAAHTISQRTNAKFGFHSAAVLLAVSPAMRMEGFGEETTAQAVSCIFEFLPLVEMPPRVVYPPTRYREIILRVYRELGLATHLGEEQDCILPEESDIEVDINYEDEYALLVVRRYGQDFRDAAAQVVGELDLHPLNALQIDLPLSDPYTPQALPPLLDLGFIFSGLMPFFHQERDYLRLQRIPPGFDFELVKTYSELGRDLKHLTAKEYHDLQTRKQTPGDHPRR